MALKWCPTAIFAFFSVIEMQQHFRKGHLETGASHEGKPLGEYLEVSLQSRDPSKHWARRAATYQERYAVHLPRNNSSRTILMTTDILS